jgi:hypothetical protein
MNCSKLVSSWRRTVFEPSVSVRVPWLAIRRGFRSPWGRHDTQHNDSQHNDSQHNDFEHNDF